MEHFKPSHSKLKLTSEVLERAESLDPYPIKAHYGTYGSFSSNSSNNTTPVIWFARDRARIAIDDEGLIDWTYRSFAVPESNWRMANPIGLYGAIFLSVYRGVVEPIATLHPISGSVNQSLALTVSRGASYSQKDRVGMVIERVQKLQTGLNSFSDTSMEFAIHPDDWVDGFASPSVLMELESARDLPIRNHDAYPSRKEQPHCVSSYGGGNADIIENIVPDLFALASGRSVSSPVKQSQADIVDETIKSATLEVMAKAFTL